MSWPKLFVPFTPDINDEAVVAAAAVADVDVACLSHAVWPNLAKFRHFGKIL